MVGVDPHSWRVDPGGELHAFDRGRLWAVCRLTCLSLTADVSESTRARAVCPHCAALRSRRGAQAVPLDAIRGPVPEQALQGVCAMTPPDLPALPSDAVEATVDALCELNRRSGIVFAVHIGRTLVEGVYDGDLNRVRDRRADCPTLRAIAAHPRVPFSLTALHQAIGVFDLVRRFPEVQGTALTLTHLRLVLPFGDDVQRRLLRQAICGGWNTRQLEEAARAVKPTRGKGGRPRLPMVVKTLNHIDRVAREEVAWGDLDELAALPPAQRRALARRVAQLQRQLRGVELRLEAEGDTAVGGEDVPALPAGES